MNCWPVDVSTVHISGSWDRTLAINPVEAKTVQSIFRLYLQRGCVNKPKAVAETWEKV